MVKLQTHGIPCALAMMMMIALPLAASAQQAPTAPAPSAAPPEQIAPPKTEPGPDATQPSAKPPAVNPSETPAAPQTARDLVGLDVFSSDGTRVGEVRSVSTGPSGDIVALRIRTGGFLGFGGRIVAIPHGKFIRSGQSIRLDLDSDEVTGLPEMKD